MPYVNRRAGNRERASGETAPAAKRCPPSPRRSAGTARAAFARHAGPEQAPLPALRCRERAEMTRCSKASCCPLGLRAAVGDRARNRATSSRRACPIRARSRAPPGARRSTAACCGRRARPSGRRSPAWRSARRSASSRGIAFGLSRLTRRADASLDRVAAADPVGGADPARAADLRLRLPHGDRGGGVRVLLAAADHHRERGARDRAAPDRGVARARLRARRRASPRSCCRPRCRACSSACGSPPRCRSWSPSRSRSPPTRSGSAMR